MCSALKAAAGTNEPHEAAGGGGEGETGAMIRGSGRGGSDGGSEGVSIVKCAGVEQELMESWQ